MTDIEDQPPLLSTSEQLESVLDAIDHCVLFVLGSGGDILQHNRVMADRILPFVNPTDWLNAQGFTDVEKQEPLRDASALAKVLLGDRGSRGKRVHYVTPFGLEYVTNFVATPLRGTPNKLVVGRDRELPRKKMRPALSLAMNKALHDLGNVLGIIQIASEGLVMQELPEEASVKAKDILAAVGRGHRLLYSFQQPQAQPTERILAEVDVALRDASGIFRRVLPKGIEFDVDIQGEGFNVDATHAGG